MGGRFNYFYVIVINTVAPSGGVARDIVRSFFPDSIVIRQRKCLTLAKRNLFRIQTVNNVLAAGFLVLAINMAFDAVLLLYYSEVGRASDINDVSWIPNPNFIKYPYPGLV